MIPGDTSSLSGSHKVNTMSHDCRKILTGLKVGSLLDIIEILYQPWQPLTKLNNNPDIRNNPKNKRIIYKHPFAYSPRVSNAVFLLTVNITIIL